VRSGPTAFLALALAAPAAKDAAATGFTDGEDLYARPDTLVRVDGTFRLRGEADNNFDLDRGTTPSGAPLFFTPLADPTAQGLSHGDLRLRTDLALYAPFGGVAVKVRADLLDNLTLGGNPDGAPASATTQQPPLKAVRIKRAYGEALTPIGLLSAGRIGSTWGLGMLTNGGDCLDCDSGDAADRIAFVTPIAGLLWALAYDFGFSGPSSVRKDSTRAIDLEPSAGVHTITFAFLDWTDPVSRERRRAADKTTLEFGALASYRWQKNDVPAEYLSLATPVTIDAAQIVPRDFTSTALDGWARLQLPWLRVEAEAAVLISRVGQASLIPGVLLRDPVKARQIGAALETEIGALDWSWFFGLDAGYASGDPSYGLDAFPRPGALPPPPPSASSATAFARRVTHLDYFRFHPDYRIDRILFREIIGTVTDAVYLRPHVLWRIASIGPGLLQASTALIASAAVEAQSTPSGKSPLGIEIDPTLFYQSRDGFFAAAEYAVLFPLAGLDNPAQGLTAKPAQQIRLRVAYVF
jgi:uncharacterized protein (TIGR04551 family)